MATEKSIYDTLRNNKYRFNLPDIYKTQHFIDKQKEVNYLNLKIAYLKI